MLGGDLIYKVVAKVVSPLMNK